MNLMTPQTSKDYRLLNGVCFLHQYCKWLQQKKEKKLTMSCASSGHINKLKQSILRLRYLWMTHCCSAPQTSYFRCLCSAQVRFSCSTAGHSIDNYRSQVVYGHSDTICFIVFEIRSHLKLAFVHQIDVSSVGAGRSKITVLL